MIIFNCVAARLMQVEAIAFKQSPCLSLHRMQHLGIQDTVEVDLRREIYELQEELQKKDDELEEIHDKAADLAQKMNQDLNECYMSKTRYKKAYESFLQILNEMLEIAHNLRYEDEKALDLLRDKLQEFADELKPKYSQRYLEA